MTPDESAEKIPLRKKMGLGRGLDALLGEAIRGESSSAPAPVTESAGVQDSFAQKCI